MLNDLRSGWKKIKGNVELENDAVDFFWLFWHDPVTRLDDDPKMFAILIKYYDTKILQSFPTSFVYPFHLLYPFYFVVGKYFPFIGTRTFWSRHPSKMPKLEVVKSWRKWHKLLFHFRPVVILMHVRYLIC